MAKRLKTPLKEGDHYHRKYQHERIAACLIDALEKAGRESEVLAVCEREARETGSYERLVKLLLERKQYEEAERWAAEGIEKTASKLPGIASSLGKLMGEVANQRKQWTIAAAHAAWEFFEHPSRESFQQLIKASAKAGCEESVRAFALAFWRLVSRRCRRRTRANRGTRLLQDGRYPCPAISFLCCAPTLGRGCLAPRISTC